MMQDNSILTGNAVRSSATVATAGEDTMKGKAQHEFMMKLSWWQKSPKLNLVLYITEAEHGLGTVSCPCDDAYTVEFTNRNSVKKKRNCVTSVGERAAECIPSNYNVQGRYWLQPPRITGIC